MMKKEKEIPQVNIVDFDKINQIVERSANIYWRRSYWKIRNFVFADIYDVRQVVWVRFLESKQVREILTTPKPDEYKMLYTIASRAIIDYIRSQCGRFETSDKAKQWIHTSYYMGYTREEMKDLIDAPADESRSVEDAYIEAQLTKEIYNFINTKMGTREKFVAEMIFKNDVKQRDIADMMGVTESRVGQIKSKVIKSVRKKMPNFEEWK